MGCSAIERLCSHYRYRSVYPLLLRSRHFLLLAASVLPAERRVVVGHEKDRCSEVLEAEVE